MTANQLQKMLDRAGLSQRKCAKLIGLHERSMRRYCGGFRAIPRVVELAVECVCLHRDRSTPTSED
jgi:hypothetical protein